MIETADQGQGSMPKEFRLKRRVQFYETDAAGIVHFSWFLRYMEEAEHAMWRAAGLSIAPQGSEIGWPRVAASIEFHRPLRFEDEFDVHLWIAAKDAGTIQYKAVMTRGETRIASGGFTVACVTRRSDGVMRRTDIPPEIDALFQVRDVEG